LEELLQEEIYDENDQMEKEAEKIARWVSRTWKKRKTLQASKTESMATVVAQAMAAHDNETIGETSSLLEKKEDVVESGILSFFQNITK